MDKFLVSDGLNNVEEAHETTNGSFNINVPI